MNQLSMLPFMFPPAKTSLHDVFGLWHSFLYLLTKKTHFICLYNQQNSCWTPVIDSNNWAYLDIQHFKPESSVQIKNIFTI